MLRGGVTTPTLTVPTTDQIEYSVEPDGVDPPFVAGQTVTVTATLVGGGAGLQWVEPLPDPWVAGDPPETVATRPVTFKSVACTSVVP